MSAHELVLSFLRCWSPFLLAMFGVVVTVALCVLLGFFEGSLPPPLPGDLTLQSVASFISTVAVYWFRGGLSTATIYLAWSEARENGLTLREFVTLLSLTTDPLGLFSRTLYSAILKRSRVVFVFLLLIGLANEWYQFFAQQAIHTRLHQQIRHDAILPISLSLEQARANAGQVLGNLPQGYENVTVPAPFAQDIDTLQVAPSCPGNYCHWQAASLAIRFQCTDLSHLVQEFCHPKYCDYGLTHDGVALQGLGAQLNNKRTLVFENSSLFSKISQPLSNFQFIAKPRGGGLGSVRAMQCVQYPAAVVYASHYANGKFHERILSEWYNTTGHFSFEPDTKNDPGFITLAPGGQYGSHNFTIDQQTWIALQYESFGYFDVSIVAGIVQSGNENIANLVYLAMLEGTMGDVYAKRSLAQTSFFRTHDALNSTALGIAFTQQRVFSIRWGWLVLPFVVTIVTPILAWIACARSQRAKVQHLGNDALSPMKAAPDVRDWPVDFNDNIKYTLGWRTNRFTRVPSLRPTGVP